MANWRRKWRRTPVAGRAGAAAALGDLFVPRRTRGVLRWVVLASLVAHVPAVVLLRTGRGTNLEVLAKENTYLQKVIQKERAKEISREVKKRITMPPPPPDPEAVVGETLTSEITTDISRVIGDMLPVDVTRSLATRVTTDLAAELAEASRSIAAGQYSEEDIKKLQEQFRQKAHAKTVQALHAHREKTQVEHAKMSVTEWYESRLGATLKAKIHSELFTRHGAVWSGVYGRSHWGFVRLWYGDCFRYRRKVSTIGALAAGQHYDPHGQIGGRPLQHGQRLLPDWPKPSAAQARGIETVARYVRDESGYRNWVSSFNGYLKAFHPHRYDQLQADVGKKVEALWAQLFKDVQAYQAKAAGGPAAEVAAAQQACLKTVKAIHDTAAKILVRDEGPYAVVNQAVRSRVLRGPAREKAYGRFVGQMVAAFKPAVVDVAENEFREGILIRREGVDEAAQEFTRKILALLRRDVQAALPKGRFDDLVFETGVNPYVSEITGQRRPPTPDDIARDEKALAAVVATWPQADRAYPQKRAEVIAEQFEQIVGQVARALAGNLIDDGRFSSRFYASVESVDYTDKVQQRLDARARALAGRGQDLAQLTDDGVPDASASMVALMFGASKGHGASLEPVATTMVPAHVVTGRSGKALRPCRPTYPPTPRTWARITQPEVTPPFEHYRCEGIPFLANFPKLDGDLTDWGAIRPLVTQKIRWITCPDQKFLIYAAWNYQGFFFGYHVKQEGHRFAYPAESRPADTSGLVMRRATGYRWAYTGDNLRLLFDTLDARSARRGEPHTQEFVIFPRGLESNPDVPGIERIIKSERDSKRRRSRWGEIIASTKVFPPQPSPADGPDGTGPYRATKFGKKGYSTEVFLPRSLFNVPVFCPGWYVGFEAVVGMGDQTHNHGGVYGQLWANKVWNGHGELGDKDFPKDWGDLLLLGTDARLAVQDADETGTLSRAVSPGHSYLLTVIDPDRNVNLAAEDIVLVSAEVLAGPSPSANDVEVFILKETGKNTSIFRGYVNTQPGRGRQVQGVIEVLAGQEIRFGYLDLANAEGKRNVVYHSKLPVVASLTVPLTASR